MSRRMLIDLHEDALFHRVSKSPNCSLPFAKQAEIYQLMETPEYISFFILFGRAD